MDWSQALINAISILLGALIARAPDLWRARNEGVIQANAQVLKAYEALVLQLQSEVNRLHDQCSRTEAHAKKCETEHEATREDLNKAIARLVILEAKQSSATTVVVGPPEEKAEVV